jgi:hypothetical protein
LPSSGQGEYFAREARLLFRVVACTGSEALPPNIDPAIVEEHCGQLKPRMNEYRAQYLAQASPYLAKIRTADLPQTVVYPFGGGDLLSALTTYPDAKEITTLSLELAGDPRRIHSLVGESLRESLREVRDSLQGLLVQSDSTSENLQKAQRGEIPGQIAFFLVALAIHGFEPTGLKYFQLQPDGAAHYLSAREIQVLEQKTANPRHRKWMQPDFSEAFANSELLFRRAGSSEQPRVHRHIGANLSDAAFGKNSPILRHLAAKGQVAAMTKAASYTLWNPRFTEIRDYLLDHAAIMISDSTGIPPDIALGHGFSLECFGRFEGSLLPASPEINEEFRALWKSQPYRPLPFRYGYWDVKANYHMLVIRGSGKM